MKSSINLPKTIPSLPILLTLACCAISPITQAVSPAPDGGYAGGNTAEGQNALLSLTSGAYNTAVGLFSLKSDTTGKFNTGVGAGTLLANTADENTATGTGALGSNSTGSNNTANGAFALWLNTTGSSNNAVGALALFKNVTGNFNTAIGDSALESNTSGEANVAVGADALTNNNADGNTAVGAAALAANTTGASNTAVGSSALENNISGENNTAIGDHAGFNQTDGSNNVYIGQGIQGIAGESNTCRIASIFGQTAATGSAVFITSGNKLGTDTSSKRFKEEIKPMEQASEALYSLKPVTFRYKKEIDAEAKRQFGLVAEEVEKVNPDLVVRDKEGKAYSVRYDQVNAMLLNEFLKEHQRIQELESKLQTQELLIAEQQRRFQTRFAEEEKQIETLALSFQKVTARFASVNASGGGLAVENYTAISGEQVVETATPLHIDYSQK